MSARVVLLTLLLVLPTATALDLPLVGPAPVAPDAPAAVPDGCREDGAAYACHFSFKTASSPVQNGYFYEVPAFPRSIATVTVELVGADRGWQVHVLREYNGTNMSIQRVISSSAHEPAPGARPAYVAREATTHVLTDANLTFRGADLTPGRTFLLFYQYVPATSYTGSDLNNVEYHSEGSFDIYYVAERVPTGAPPERPAATQADPQLQGFANDAVAPELDLVGAWLDDRVLGDGLMDVHVAVRGNLTRFDWNRTTAPLDLPASPVRGDGVTETREFHWQLHFKVGDVRYFVMWSARNPNAFGSNASTAPAGVFCELYRVTGTDASGQATVEHAGSPSCSFNDTVLSAEFAERSIRSPGAGDLFQDLSANADEILSNTQGNYVAQRDGITARWKFALGGPQYWDAYNDCAFCPPPVHWWQAPLTPDNLPNTVQVAGGAIAIVGFFGGLILYRRRRAKVRALLREIERVEVEHERDTRAALLSLGALDSKFADMYHRGALNDDQYQVVAQRLATAATRFALRQGLGLDDGVAGDRGRSIPIQGPEREARP